MCVDLQVAAHFGQEIAPDFLLPVFQGREFLAQVQAAMASFSLVGYELTWFSCAAPVCEPAFRTRRLSRFQYRTLLSEPSSGFRAVPTPPRYPAAGGLPGDDPSRCCVTLTVARRLATPAV